MYSITQNTHDWILSTRDTWITFFFCECNISLPRKLRSNFLIRYLTYNSSSTKCKASDNEKTVRVFCVFMFSDNIHFSEYIRDFSSRSKNDYEKSNIYPL